MCMIIIFFMIVKLCGNQTKKSHKTKLQLHETSVHHMTAVIRWSAHTNSQKTGNIISLMSTANQEQIKKNREYIKCLFDIVVFLGRQGLAYRGHREDESSLNKGTYLFL